MDEENADDDVQILEDHPDNSEEQDVDENEIEVRADQPNIPEDEDSCQSKPKVVDDDDEEGYLCVICCCPFTNSGDHRLSCLTCGHIFGMSCIERWLRTGNSTCPSCNKRARKKDIRVLFTKQLQALDTAERDRALKELEETKVLYQQANFEIAKLTLKNKKDSEEILRLQEEVKKYQNIAKELEAIIQGGNGLPGKAALDALKNTPTSKLYVGDGKSDKVSFYTAHTRHIWQGEDCRVATFSEWSNAFVVSQKFNRLTNSSLWKSLGGFGVRIFNWGDPRKWCNMPVHQKEIRDLAFSPTQTDLLLTVGMDCRACLTNIHSQLQVLTFTTEHPIWSCAFNSTDPNIIYFGMQNGQIAVYDIRKQREVMDTLIFQQDTTPVSRLHYIPPSYQQEQSGFSSAGLLAQKLKTCWLVEHSANTETNYHQLPFEGTFLGIDFEPRSRHLLVSTRPTGSNPTRHMVCEIVRNSYEGGGNSFGCNIVKQYQGGGNLGKIYRPKIFSPAENKVFVASSRSNSEVDMWDISESNLKQTFSVPSIVLDCVPVTYNEVNYMTLLTSDSLEVYKY